MACTQLFCPRCGFSFIHTVAEALFLINKMNRHLLIMFSPVIYYTSFQSTNLGMCTVIVTLTPKKNITLIKAGFIAYGNIVISKTPMIEKHIQHMPVF